MIRLADCLMSQRECARRLGISHAAVAQAERSAIVKICIALDLPAPYEFVRKSWQQRKERGQIPTGESLHLRGG